MSPESETKIVPRRRTKWWLNRTDHVAPWIDALLDIDNRDRDDKTALITLLRSSRPMPKEARWHLADLLERFILKRPQNRPRTPSYDISKGETPLFFAKQSHRREKKAGLKPVPLAERAETYGVAEESYALYHSGRQGSARRMKRRRYPPKPG